MGDSKSGLCFTSFRAVQSCLQIFQLRFKLFVFNVCVSESAGL